MQQVARVDCLLFVGLVMNGKERRRESRTFAASRNGEVDYELDFPERESGSEGGDVVAREREMIGLRVRRAAMGCLRDAISLMAPALTPSHQTRTGSCRTRYTTLVHPSSPPPPRPRFTSTRSSQTFSKCQTSAETGQSKRILSSTFCSTTTTISWQDEKSQSTEQITKEVDAEKGPVRLGRSAGCFSPFSFHPGTRGCYLFRLAGSW